MQKRGLMQLPFSMIFSIILIIVFIALAVYAIIIILNIGQSINTGLFKQDLQEAIDRAWTSDSSSEIFKSKLGSGIKEVCFVDFAQSSRGENIEYYNEAQLYLEENKNIFFWPLEKAPEGQRGFEIKHLDIMKITERENPHCVDNINGRVEMKIKKGFNDALVCVDCLE